MTTGTTLLAIVPDRLSDIIRKGEFSARYYNPGSVFSEVHLLATNDDVVDAAALQYTVGTARLVVHNIPFGQSRAERWLRWSRLALDRWADKVVDLARRIRPSLVRCYGSDVNAYAALRIWRALRVPYVVSIHTARDESPEPRTASQRIAALLWERLERRTLGAAARVMPVYRAVVPQLRRLGVERIDVAYNVLNPECLRQKTNYALHHPVRILTIGRQLPYKRPDAIVRAIASLPSCQLTVIGDGPVHSELRELARGLALDDRILFRAAMPNDELCASLADYDIFAGHSDYCEIPKAVLEPLLTGLPVVMNRRAGTPVPEFEDDIVVLVENSSQAYREALSRLIENDAVREALGRRAYRHAQALWSPARTETHVAQTYRDVMAATE